jgi:hypothetical protein
MMYAVAIPLSIAAIGWTLYLIDWLSRRQERRKREGRT